MKTEDRQEQGLPECEGAVGIVVRSGARDAARPRAIAFLWGAQAPAVPSLPYGRWKSGLRPAA